jgi:glucosyl-3-phosphoglycerate synthase
LKTFLKMHSPIIVSAMILLAMCTTLLGSVHFEGGKVSIQPVSRNLIIFNSPTNNQTVDVRGPYTVDKALENENTSIRMPTEALATLELNYGDSIYINNEKYILNVTRPKEDNTMRIPNAALTSMGLNPGDVISDGDLRNRFNNFYAEKALQTNGNSDNINITEGTILTNNMQSGYNINLYLNNTLVSSSYGIIKNGSYSIYINDVKYKTITLNQDNLNQPYTVVIGDDIFKIEFGTPLMTDMEFANSSSGKFLNFIY